MPNPRLLDELTSVGEVDPVELDTEHFLQFYTDQAKEHYWVLWHNDGDVIWIFKSDADDPPTPRTLREVIAVHDYYYKLGRQVGHSRGRAECIEWAHRLLGIDALSQRLSEVAFALNNPDKGP